MSPSIACFLEVLIRKEKYGIVKSEKFKHHRTKHNMKFYSEADKMSLAMILQTDIN